MSRLARFRGAIAKAISPVQHVPAHWPVGWFQQGMDKTYMPSSRGGSVVEACVSAYAQTIAMLPGKHYRTDENGTRVYLQDTALSRVLHKPNEYQTRSDFMLNLVHSILYEGNGYMFGTTTREGTRFTELHLLDPRATHARRVRDTGDVFYQTSGIQAEFAEVNDDGAVLIPSRYIGHVRLFTPHDPLRGVTPIQHSGPAIAAHNAITNHQASFFSNMARPSGVLSTDLTLKREQVQQLREAWQDQSKGLNSGGVPILSGGLKFSNLSMSSQDAELVEAWRMTVEEIARVFRVPQMIIGSMDNATFNNAEQLIGMWLSTGLQFLIDHIENAIAAMYRLPPNEGVEMDVEVLLRTDFKARVEALGEGVTKGVLSPNEGRGKLGLEPVDGGDMPRVQQQMVPLDWVDPQTQQNEPQTTPPDEEPDVDIDVEQAMVDIRERLAA